MLALLAAPLHAEAAATPQDEAAADTESLSRLPEPTQMDAAPDFFEKGSRYWSTTAGASYDATLGPIYFTEVSISHGLGEYLAIEYGGIFGYADARRTTSGVLGGPEIGVSWHFPTGTRWSTYLEGLVGAVFHQYPLADHTLRFNFDLQPGGGAAYRLSDGTVVQGGFRWHHLSNAQIRGRAHNFGYDGPTLYLKMMRSF